MRHSIRAQRGSARSALFSRVYVIYISISSDLWFSVIFHKVHFHFHIGKDSITKPKCMKWNSFDSLFCLDFTDVLFFSQPTFTFTKCSHSFKNGSFLSIQAATKDPKLAVILVHSSHKKAGNNFQMSYIQPFQNKASLLGFEFKAEAIRAKGLLKLQVNSVVHFQRLTYSNLNFQFHLARLIAKVVSFQTDISKYFLSDI